MSYQLNELQNTAKLHLSSPLLVLAGAGSGKTSLMAHKIAHLIEKSIVPPQHIVGITFTNKSAKELLLRVNKLCGNDASKVRILTFHALGLKILKKFGNLLDFNIKNLSIYDSEDSLQLLKRITIKDSTDNNTTDKSILISKQWQISQWKNSNINPQQAISVAKDSQELNCAQTYAIYQESLKKYNAVDFDDLITLPYQLLQTNESVAAYWQNSIKYLLVDEYQDTNLVQYNIIKAILGLRSCLTVVGDDHQSIYAWRGADSFNMQRLQQDFPSLTTIKLEQNYRSTATILQAANHLISHNPQIYQKKLWSTLGQGELIKLLNLKNEEDEAFQIGADIKHSQFTLSKNWHDYAVLYRSNHQARAIEKMFRELQIPYQVTGGTSFFNRTEIKDLLAYLKLVINPDDDAAFLRIVNVPRRGIGEQSIHKLIEYAKKRETSLLQACGEIGLQQILEIKPYRALENFSRLLSSTSHFIEKGDILENINNLIAEIDYRAWLEETSQTHEACRKRQGYVDELIEWLTRLLQENDTNLAQALQKICLHDILQNNDKEENKQLYGVQLLTLHAAKGLEFPFVYILGCEEGNIPNHNSIAENKIEEERRLMYVGITRAQKKLTLSWVNNRQGQATELQPSRFISELPANLLSKNTEGGTKNKQVGKQALELIKQQIHSALNPQEK